MAEKFRFNASRVFLTYSQTPRRFTPQVVLKQITKKAEVKDYLISQEHHKDGGTHIHAYIEFTKKLDTKDSRFFDLEYYRQGYHPNIQKVTKVHRLWEYIKKDKKYITNIEETRPVWKQILEDAESMEDALTRVMWHIGRIDNYAGYRTFRDLLESRTFRPERVDPVQYIESVRKRSGGDRKIEE